MHRLMCCIAALAPCVLLAGCGGGGGSTTSTLDNTLRLWQPGDEWTYSVTDTVNNGVETLPVSGSWKVTVSAQTVTTPTGVTARVVQETVTLRTAGSQEIIESKSYVVQDPDGTIWKYGGEDEDGVFWVTSPLDGRYVELASPLGIAVSWGDQVEMSNGLSFDSWEAVVARETVSVPAGRFETYRATANATVLGYPLSGTEWIAPQIGNSVKLAGTVSDPNEGITLSLTLSLVSRTRAEGASDTVHPKGSLEEAIRSLWRQRNSN